MFGRKPGGFSDTKSGTGRRRSAAMGGWVLTHIVASSRRATLWSILCVCFDAVRIWANCLLTCSIILTGPIYLISWVASWPQPLFSYMRTAWEWWGGDFWPQGGRWQDREGSGEGRVTPIDPSADYKNTTLSIPLVPYPCQSLKLGVCTNLILSFTEASK